jgi:hypothetical protein
MNKEYTAPFYTKPPQVLYKYGPAHMRLSNAAQ